MKNIKVNLVDGDYDGTMIMTSPSKVSAVRVAKNRVSEVTNELNEPGIYFLLVGNDDVYVGESGLDTVGNRIMKPHSGSIDSSWHTVVGFPIADKSLDNELLYIENAMCEYVYGRYGKCLTTTPAQKNCNAAYRNVHYHLNAGQILTSKQYVADIEWYISMFPHMIFPKTSTAPSVKPTGSAYFLKGKSSGADASAVLGTDGKLTILKGSKISANESASLPAGMKKRRSDLVADGTIQNNVFMKDWPAPSVSTAANVVLGSPTNGRAAWKTAKGEKVDDELKKMGM